MSLLTTKFKYERQKLGDVAEVQASRKRLSVNNTDAEDVSGVAERCRRIDVSGS